ncbi:MAG: DEAD/DEAH box helicase, partial [Deltaproteobacteria bacterium]|nr:DEAD/DEAH box helicase [Deltaproteobacteria bacterium]
MPGHNEESIRKTPVLELYEAGARFRRSLDTLVQSVAATRVKPDAIRALLDRKPPPTLEQADRWLDEALAASSTGLGTLLEASSPALLVEALGGKTEAVVFPALAQLIEREPSGVGVIYIAPIKALLNNQRERLATYTEMVGLESFVWHGDVEDHEKQRFVREPADLLLTTPESLEVMLVSPRFPTPMIFQDLGLVIIDEIHALAGTDRGAHLMSVLERLLRHTERDVQRVGLSATVGNPAEILTWLRGTSRRDGVVIDLPHALAKRELHIGLHGTVLDLARAGAGRAAGKKSLFFCNSRALTESVTERMRGRGTEVFVHHSSVSAEERKAAEDRFH